MPVFSCMTPLATLSLLMKADRFLVVDAEAVEQGGERIAGADFFFVDELLGFLLERGDLVRQVRQFQVLRDGFDWEVGRIRGKRRDARGAECADCKKDRASADDARLSRRS